MSTNDRGTDRRYTERSSEQTIKNEYKTERYERAVPVRSQQSEQMRRRRSDRYRTQSDSGTNSDGTGDYASSLKGTVVERGPAQQGRGSGDRGKTEKRKSGILLPAVLILLAVLLLLFAVYELVPPVHSAVQRLIHPSSGNTETAASSGILEFKTSSENYYTGSYVQFVLTTSTDVTNVRVLDYTGNVLDGTPVRDNPGDTTVAIWNVNVFFSDEYSGYVYASVYASGQWQNTDRYIQLNVAKPASTPVPTASALPSQAPASTGQAGAVSVQATNIAVQNTVTVSAAQPGQNVTAIPQVTVSPTDAPATGAPETDAPAETAAAAAAAAVTADATPQPTDEPTPSPVPTQTPFSAYSVSGSAPSDLGLTETVYSGGSVQKNYRREIPYLIQAADHYTFSSSGVYTFRGDNFRRNAAYGTVNVTEGKLVQVWEYPLGGLRTDSAGTLYGVGWNNQPAIVKWAKEIREMMNVYSESKAEQAMREVIFSAQDGNVYFINLMTGEASRAPINIGYPMRGSVSVDSIGRPLISFGQAISKLPNKTGAIGYYIYNMIDSSRIFFINGRQSDIQKQYSTNGAFDGTSLFIHNEGRDAMVVAGENGLLYSVDLNSVFFYPTKEDPDIIPAITMNPQVIYQSSLAKNENKARTTIESAIAMYNTYVYAADGYGILRCVDTNTMRSVWAFDTGDNTDAAIALDLRNNGLDLYTGTTAFSRTGKNKPVVIRKMNALTGEVLWEYPIQCVVDHSNETSGCKASPVIGQNDLDGLVFFNVNRVADGGALLIALDKSTGSMVWQFAMDESISSPVAVYNEAGNGWIIQADSTGHLYMLDGKTGYLNSTLQVDGCFEASPAVYKDRLCIGTCSKNPKMYCFEIK